MDNKKSYFDLFAKQANIISDHIWANGERGSMSFFNQHRDVFYRFMEMPNGMDANQKKSIQRYGITGGIVAMGIVARWIFRYPSTPITNIFAENYYEEWQNYVKHNQSMPDMSGKTLSQKAYEHCIKKEADNIRLSYNVFRFVSKEDQAVLRCLINNYLIFLYKQAGMITMEKDEELLVLRHLSSGAEELLPEGMEDYIFNATCDRLERKGYIQVAWLEGHTPEDVRLLDSGRAYLSQLETQPKRGNEMHVNDKSSEKLLKEEIDRLKKELKEKQQIIAEKENILRKYEKGDDDEGDYIYILGRGDKIKLTLKERNIIEYVIHCMALQPEDGKLTANIHRLIGKGNTVRTHFEISKRTGDRPLTNEEKKNIKKVLEAEHIKYKKWLKEHL